MLGQMQCPHVDLPSTAIQLCSRAVRESLVRGYRALAHTWNAVHPLGVLLKEAVEVDRCAFFEVVCDLYFDLESVSLARAQRCMLELTISPQLASMSGPGNSLLTRIH